MITLECNFVLNWLDCCFSLLLRQAVFLKITTQGGKYKQQPRVTSNSWKLLQNVSKIKCLWLCALIDQEVSTLHFSSLVLYWLTTDNKAQYVFPISYRQISFSLTSGACLLICALLSILPLKLNNYYVSFLNIKWIFAWSLARNLTWRSRTIQWRCHIPTSPSTSWIWGC